MKICVENYNAIYILKTLVEGSNVYNYDIGSKIAKTHLYY